MTALRWIEDAGGEIVADGRRLEAVMHGPPPDKAPTIVMLHEGLGCVALWRDFPAKLAAATGWGVFAYSRAGYGQSDPVDLPRPLDYMSSEARSSLPATLETIGMKRGILLGQATAPRSRRSTAASNGTSGSRAWSSWRRTSSPKSRA
jgi:pimeloyl-ACP methyl ester carboxylesterase